MAIMLMVSVEFASVSVVLSIRLLIGRLLYNLMLVHQNGFVRSVMQSKDLLPTVMIRQGHSVVVAAIFSLALLECFCREPAVSFRLWPAWYPTILSTEPYLDLCAYSFCCSSSSC
ncbi:unnamed protein product [Prunus armeniaca]